MIDTKKKPKFRVGQAVDVLPVRVHVEQIQKCFGGFVYYCDDGVLYTASQIRSVRQRELGKGRKQ